MVTKLRPAELFLKTHTLTLSHSWIELYREHPSFRFLPCSSHWRAHQDFRRKIAKLELESKRRPFFSKLEIDSKRRLFFSCFGPARSKKSESGPHFEKFGSHYSNTSKKKLLCWELNSGLLSFLGLED